MFNASLNRSLPVIIGAYRYIYVFHWNLVFTDIQKKRVNIFLIGLLFFLPVCCAVGPILYPDNTRRFNICMGREEQFFYDFQDIFMFRLGILSKYSNSLLNKVLKVFNYRQEFLHPVRILNTVSFFLFVVFVPYVYLSIFYWRKYHQGKGLNVAERRSIKHRNVVSMWYNMAIWVSEVTALGLLVSKSFKKNLTTKISAEFNRI